MHEYNQFQKWLEMPWWVWNCRLYLYVHWSHNHVPGYLFTVHNPKPQLIACNSLAYYVYCIDKSMHGRVYSQPDVCRRVYSQPDACYRAYSQLDAHSTMACWHIITIINLQYFVCGAFRLATRSMACINLAHHSATFIIKLVRYLVQRDLQTLGPLSHDMWPRYALRLWPRSVRFIVTTTALGFLNRVDPSDSVVIRDSR